MEISNVKRECNITINGKTVEGGNLTNVPMNSPECIKKKLNGYSARYLSGNNWGREILGTGEIMHNAFFYIQQLESRLAQVERERDAMFHDLFRYGPECRTCKNHGGDYASLPCSDCVEASKISKVLRWQWRGVCPENSKEEK